MRLVWRGLVIVLFFVASVTLAPASPAFADWTPRGFEWSVGKRVGAPDVFDTDNYVCHASRFHGATACFKLVGDDVYVRDRQADGQSAVGIIYSHVDCRATRGCTTRKHICRNKRGNDTWVRCRKDFPEGAEMTVESCDYDGDRNKIIDPCGSNYIHFINRNPSGQPSASPSRSRVEASSKAPPLEADDDGATAGLPRPNVSSPASPWSG